MSDIKKDYRKKTIGKGRDRNDKRKEKSKYMNEDFSIAEGDFDKASKGTFNLEETTKSRSITKNIIVEEKQSLKNEETLDENNDSEEEINEDYFKQDTIK